jgi:hypothetical protein
MSDALNYLKALRPLYSVSFGFNKKNLERELSLLLQLPGILGESTGY